jgi:hypothetical protein
VGASSNPSDYGKAIGKCCNEYPDWSACESFAASCKRYYESDEDVPKGAEEWAEVLEDECEAFCGELKEAPDWCPSGLSTAETIGVVVGCVVVVGAVAGVFVYFCVIKPKKAVAAGESEE